MTTGRPSERPQEEPPDVARRRRGRPAGQLGERDGDRIDEVVGEPAEAGSQDDPDLGHDRRPGTDGGLERGQPGWLIGRWDRSRRIDLGDGPDMRPPLRIRGFDGRGRKTSSARRKYRHRDADHVPSGTARSEGRGETATARQRSARSDRRRNQVLDAISGPRSCRPLRARPTVRAAAGAGQRGYPRSPNRPLRANPRLAAGCGQPVEKRPQPPIANISIFGSVLVAADRSSEYRSPRRVQIPSTNAVKAASEASDRRTLRQVLPVDREEAGVQLALGRDPGPRAVAAERLGHRRDDPELATAVEVRQRPATSPR